MEGMILLVVLLLVYGFLGLALMIRYVLYSLSLMELGSRLGVKDSWLAWIPVANLFVLGASADALEAKRNISHNWRKILLFLSIAAYAVLAVALVGLFAFVIGLAILESNMEPSFEELAPLIWIYLLYFAAILAASALQFLNMICIYKIYEELNPKKSIKYILLTLLVPFGDVYCLSRCKNMIPRPVFPTTPVYTDPAFGYDVSAASQEEQIHSEEQDRENRQQ